MTDGIIHRAVQQMTLERQCNVVIIGVVCKDDYEAMLMHDELEASLDRGSGFNLNIKSGGRSDGPQS